MQVHRGTAFAAVSSQPVEAAESLELPRRQCGKCKQSLTRVVAVPRSLSVHRRHRMGRREGRPLSAAVVVRGGVQPQPEAETEWETVCGLEVHVQLDTNTKAFCGCVARPPVPSLLALCSTLHRSAPRRKKSPPTPPCVRQGSTHAAAPTRRPCPHLVDA